MLELKTSSGKKYSIVEVEQLSHISRMLVSELLDCHQSVGYNDAFIPEAFKDR
jgi:hypothetical protein